MFVIDTQAVEYLLKCLLKIVRASFWGVYPDTAGEYVFVSHSRLTL